MDGLREFVQDLKRREKPDLTVLVDHTGLAPSVQLAQDIPEFDIVLSGHTHERVYTPILVGKTIVVEPGSMGSFIGRLGHEGIQCKTCSVHELHQTIRRARSDKQP